MIYLLIATMVISLASLVLCVVLLLRKNDTKNGEILAKISENAVRSDEKTESLGKRLNDFSMQNEQKLENLRQTLTSGVEGMKRSNNEQLEIIRKTVDEKLQQSLDKKLTESFNSVSERLAQVYKGLGEMQNIASSVGDLKKVLSNVKTRGVLGEIQLGAILEEILSPGQYEANVATVHGSSNFVEYAVRLPGDGERPVYLPIDAKFPADAYAQLLDAYEEGNPEKVESAQKALKFRVRSFAKDIFEKYISPPDTTEFGIMFVPTEGLYAELVKAGMVEELQASFKVCLAGPTTMGALLNSLQMGFKTLAIQKRSSEVWKVLSAVKGEFETFATVLEKAQSRINQANDELDKLVGVRTRKITNTLKGLQALPQDEAEALLENEDEQ